MIPNPTPARGSGSAPIAPYAAAPSTNTADRQRRGFSHFGAATTRPSSESTSANTLAWWSPLLIVAGLIALWHTVWSAHFVDFKVFYRSSQAVLVGTNWYLPLSDGLLGPNLNTPLTVWLMAPLGLLPTAPAALVWTLVCLGCYGLAVWLIVRELGAWVWPIAAGAYLLTPWIANLELGQIGFSVLLLMTLAWLSDRQGKPAQAGVWLALAVYVKPFLVVLGLVLLVRRAWETLGFAAVTGLALVCLSLAIGGWELHQTWLLGLQAVDVQQVAYNASLYALVSRSLTTAPMIEALHLSSFAGTPFVNAPGLVLPLWIGGVVLAAGVVLWRFRSATVDQAWAAGILLAIWVSPIGWIHYLPMAIGPVLAVARSRWWILPVLAFALPTFPLPIGMVMGPWLTFSLGSVSVWAIGLCLWLTLHVDRGAIL